jgi:DHA1 family bicyclomycin/chloramphenicol resistance-like MFS transporter
MPDPRHATRRFRWTFAALLAALATLGPFSIDAYLPAFTGMQGWPDAIFMDGGACCQK